MVARPGLQPCNLTESIIVIELSQRATSRPVDTTEAMFEYAAEIRGQSAEIVV